jgi:dynein heavy chain
VLIDTLADSKTTSTIILERVEESERTEKELNIARGGYRPVATRGTLIYFAASDLASVDPMYQYSLQYYRALVDRCVDGSAPSTDLETRLQNILEYMTRTVYENVCRGLFEHHKLLFSVLISIKIQLHDGSVHLPEWTLLLRGAGGENAADALPNPAPGRLADLQWDLLCAAEKRCQVSKPESTEGDEGQAGEVHIHFPLKGLCQDLTGNLAAWMTWADSDSPLQLPLPNNFASSGATAFQKLLLIKALREDRLHFCMAEMVAQHLGRSFAESPGAKMEDIYRDMDNKTPCIFILSKGADPTGMLLRFAAEKGYGSRLSMVSLGQGQGPNAEELVKRGTASGDWVLLQNCMLARSWMPRMEMVVAGLAENTETNHVDFRLFLTSAPAPYFPVFVLQNGVKMTNEPPRGVRANVLRSWGSLIKPEEWDSFDDESAGKPRELKKLLLGLLFFHANVQERRKFGPLGWNISYAFDESDLETSIAVMRRFLKEQEVIPWDALRFVTGQINYGGRVTDDWDRRCITHILKIYLTSEILEEGYRFSDSGVYYSTGASAHGEATSYLSSLPGVDDPEIFGMHQNANITFNTAEGAELLRTLLSLQPRSSAGAAAGAKTDDEVVLELAATIKAEIPSQLDSEEAGPTTFVPGDDGMLGSLAIVLTQEMLKFNRLLHKMSASLDELRDAVHGLAVMNQDLDRMYTSFLSNQVPAIWAGVSFVSLKTLASWVKDLVSRVAFIRSWLKHGQPACFSLPVFFFPQGFMTGVLQTFARRYQVAIDTLSFKHEVLIMKHEEIDQGPEDGVYCSGMWLEGARFDEGQKMLQPSRPGEMYTELPPVHFLPVSGHTPDVRNYLCPVYKTAERKGVLSTTGMSTNFVVAVELPTDADAASWVLSGVAALLNLTD